MKRKTAEQLLGEHNIGKENMGDALYLLRAKIRDQVAPAPELDGFIQDRRSRIAEAQGCSPDEITLPDTSILIGLGFSSEEKCGGPAWCLKTDLGDLKKYNGQ